MGMFDDVICKYPLPHTEVRNEVFQTKDLYNCLDTYTITRSGRLYFHNYIVYVGRGKNNLGFPNVKKVNKRKKLCTYDGDINIYTEKNGYWYEYIMRLKQGKLTKIISSVRERIDTLSTNEIVEDEYCNDCCDPGLEPYEF